LLVVSALVQGSEDYAEFRCCSDGILTSRNTFQKYFEPAELQSLIEDSVKTEAVPAAMGSTSCSVRWRPAGLSVIAHKTLHRLGVAVQATGVIQGAACSARSL